MVTEREHHEYQEMLGAYALGALTDDERESLEEHLLTCDECNAELVELLVAAHSLPLSVEERAPSADLRERIRAAAVAEAGASSPDRVSTVEPEPSNVTTLSSSRPRTTRFGGGSILPWAAAAVFLLFGLGMLGWNLSLRTSNNTNEQVIALQAAPGVNGAGGQLIYLKDKQVMIVKPRGLPQLPSGQVYELWLIQGNTPIAAGVFDTANGQLAVAANMSQYRAVAITIEQGPLGSPTPSGAQVIVTPF